MEIVLLACCKTKRTGGKRKFESSPLIHYLSDEAYKQLMNSRKELASIQNFLPGLDLGFSHQENPIEFMPAYRRYNGIIYRENNFCSVDPKLNSKKVIIISALYGLLDANELIRNYELKMDHTLPIGIKVKTWWKNHGLGSIVKELVCSDSVHIVHDLLPKLYRDALIPWPQSCNNRNLIQYDYPDQGSGSIWRRAEDLVQILK